MVVVVVVMSGLAVWLNDLRGGRPGLRPLVVGLSVD